MRGATQRMGKKFGVLLTNLGSPASPDVKDIRAYLKQFLMDPYVIDLPWLLRAFFVYGVIIPFRPKSTSKAYQAIWQEAGSPLLINSQNLLHKVSQRLSIPIELGMRYGQPSIEASILALVNTYHIDSLYVIPLYPHYAMSTVTTTVEEVKRIIASRRLKVKVDFHSPFYDDQAYIKALAQVARPFLEDDFDHLLFSYHGLPEHHLKKADPTRAHCLLKEHCCAQPNLAHKTCYRFHIRRTTFELARILDLPSHKYSLAFQSRLGRAKWLTPYTDHVLRELPRKGVKRLRVICPAFVADCLETLEEMGLRGKEIFLNAGGQEYTLIPCLNDEEPFVETLVRWIKTWQRKRKQHS